MKTILQSGVLMLWAAWLVLFTISSDVLITREGPEDFSSRGPGYPAHGIACTYFTTLGMTTRYYHLDANKPGPLPDCPDRLWPALAAFHAGE